MHCLEMFAQYTDIHKQSIAKIKGQLKGLYLFFLVCLYVRLRACVFLPFATMYIYFILQLTIFRNTQYFSILNNVTFSVYIINIMPSRVIA